MTADIEVEFSFNGTREYPARDGYRPAHLVTDTYLTTGIHHYYDVREVAANGTATGTISFITPGEYPHCLWIGKEIRIQEGEKVVGTAKVLRIFNPILEAKD